MQRHLGTVLLILLCLFMSFGRASAITINTASLPEATQYQPYSAAAFTATGGTPPYTWSVTSSDATLPEGMSLNASTGVISASAVGGQGGYQFQIQVKDSLGATAASLFTINVAADNTLGGCSIFPADSIFHQRVDSLPVDTSPAAPIYSAYQSSHLRVFFGSDAGPYPDGIPFIRVPYNQPPVDMTFTAYGDESDAPNGWISNYETTTYPFPANAPVEGTANSGADADRHVLVLQTAGGGQPCKLWEVWQGSLNANGTWDSSNGAYWDLSSNNLRTNGWTSGDAAGLPIMPLTVNYDEVAAGTVNHPIRFTVNHMLAAYVWPARHSAGTGSCTGYSQNVQISQSSPPSACSMTGPAGEIYRLTSAAYATALATCPSSTNPQANAIITAMRDYGIIIADNGMTGGLIGTPDARWNDTDLACLTNFTLAQFEPVNVSSLQVSADSSATNVQINGACGSSNGAYLTAAPTANLCSVGTPSAVSGTGPWTWICNGYNNGANPSCMANAIQYTLTVNKTGSGTVTAIPTGGSSDTLAWNGNTGTASYNANTQVNISASAGTGSTFYGWSGDYAGNVTPVPITIDSATSVTATFDDYTGLLCTNPPFSIDGAMWNYPTIEAAYNALTTGDSLQIRALSFTEILNLTQGMSVQISGGYSCDYSTIAGFTTLNGTLTISGSTVTIENLILQ